MHKPLDLPLKLRVWHFIRGLLFYNTVYWKRASDELKPPRLSRRERLLHQPARDLSIIRPRDKPRANADPLPDGKPPDTHPAALPDGTPARPVEESTVPVFSTRLPAGPDSAPVPSKTSSEVVVKRRRYRRRRNKVSASSSTAADGEKPGIFGRLFRR